jgi:hypothetical protein
MYQFGASGNHTLYHTPDSWAGWADGSDAFSNPVYVDDALYPENDPLCVTKNSNTISLTGVTLKVPNGLTYPTTIRVDAAGTEDWNESGDVSFSGLTSSGATLAITGNIINEVHVYSGAFQIQWKYKVPSGTNTWYDVGTTSHTMYVKYGDTTGGQSLTEQRINWLCSRCAGNTTTLECSDDIYAGLSGSPPDFLLGGGNPSNKWQMMDPSGPSGDCIGLALLMKDMYQLLGCGDGEIGYVYGTTVTCPTDGGRGNR